MRALDPGMDPLVVAAIEARLDTIEYDEAVTIGLAVESGSRAWGFPSPDSDYDCRFVYVRRREDYLSLFSRRDVIETPLDPVLDVNGWDLRKALQLLLKGNAVLVEWLTSPLVYRGDAGFRDALLSLSRDVGQREAIARHYLYLGRSMAGRIFAVADGAPLKKVFYALRPALALRWLRLHPHEAVPPMHFPTLVAQTELPGAVRDEIAALLALKATTREMGTGAVPEPLAQLIGVELDTAGIEPAPGEIPDAERRHLVDATFRRLLCA